MSLRTPLSVLKTHLHAMCDGVIAPSDQEFRLLLAQTEHLGRLIDDLHTLAMAEAGEMSLRKERLSLGALVRESLQELQPQLQHAQMVLSQVLPEDDAVSTIRADPLRMRQIIANLVGNAVRHAASGHWLEVEVRNLRDAQGHIWIEPAGQRCRAGAAAGACARIPSGALRWPRAGASGRARAWGCPSCRR